MKPMPNQPGRRPNRRQFLGSLALMTGAAVTPRAAAENNPAPAAAAPPATARPDLAADLKLHDDYARELRATVYKQPAGILRLPYLTAGVNSFPYLVDWDAIWSGMSFVADGDPEPLRNSILNFIEHIEPDGKGQRVIKPEGYGAPVFQQRPFLCTGAFVLSRETNSVDWLGRAGFEKLHAQMRFWHSRRTGRQGLLKWWHVDEGFADNGLGNWAWDTNCVEAVDLNAQMILEHSCAAWLAAKLGLPDKANEHKQYAASLHLRMEAALWDEKAGFYFSSYNARERGTLPAPIKVFHYTNLWPLWLGLAPAARAKRVLQRVLDPGFFWSDHGIRSLSKADVHYHNAQNGMTLPMNFPEPGGPGGVCSNWQGPIWSIANYIAALGLNRYGYQAEAQTVAERIIHVHANSLRTLGVFCENYSAETGEPLAAKGGLGSWCLMLRHLPGQLKSETPWLLKDLELPRPKDA